jgi:ABC-2 type transport system ATP-binding protein
MQASPSARFSDPVLVADSITHRYGRTLALADVSLEVAAGSVNALLGPNGAGKTTLLRTLAGLIRPAEGSARVLGHPTHARSRTVRDLVGLVPSGDRSFYLRISGLENLVFFARLYGLRKRDAVARAKEVLEGVGLADAGRLRVMAYSHGMQKRLSVARALLRDPALLLVDEATHDLDPEGSRRIRALITDIAARDVAVVWATQRIDEVRGFADDVTFLNGGRVRFRGSTAQFISHARMSRHVLRCDQNGDRRPISDVDLARALDGKGTIERIGGADSDHFLLVAAPNAVLGDAIAALAAAGVRVLECRDEHSEMEAAFAALLAQVDQ